MEIYTIQHPDCLIRLEEDGFFRPPASLCMDNLDGAYYGYRICYRWMIDRLYEKCGLPRGLSQSDYDQLARSDATAFSRGWHMEIHPADGCPHLSMDPSPMPHPVWGFQKVYGRKDAKPDMRSWTTAKPEHVVRLKLDIPENRLLFSDLEYWHIPLNLGYFPSSSDTAEWEKQDEAFDEKCRECGLDNACDLFSGKVTHIVARDEDAVLHALQQELLASWNNCLVRTADLGSEHVPISFLGQNWIKRETQCVFWEILPDDVKKVEHFTTRRASRS